MPSPAQPPPISSGTTTIGQQAPFAVETITNPQQLAEASTTTQEPPGAMAYQYPASQLSQFANQPGASQNLFTMFGTPLNQQPYNTAGGSQWQYLSSNPNQIVALQEQLVASGYMSKSSIKQPGVWDSSSADAMKRAQEDANRYQAHVGDYMNWIASGGPGGPGITSTAVQDALLGKAKKPGTALEKMKATPEVAQGIYDAMLSLTGNYASAGDTKNFISWYQNQELQARQDYLNRGGASSGTYYAPPSVSTAAEQYVMSHDANQVQGFATASRMIEFYKLMGVNI